MNKIYFLSRIFNCLVKTFRGNNKDQIILRDTV